MVNNLLQIENLYKTFQSGGEELHVLEGVNLTVQAGEKVAIIGQSGSGKSTFLQIAGLLDSATKGEVKVEGVATTTMKDYEKSAIRLEKFGFVYQSHHLLTDFTALENVLMPARIQGKVTPEAVAYAQLLLEKVGLQKRAEHYPNQLSGGEQQRVAIARALMNKPQLLLADEPTGNLDPHTAAEIANLLESLVQDHGLAILMVTHNHQLAQGMDKVYSMENGVLSQ
ncbi:MAG: ABC transporter ATP-binding protein [Pseudomonadota bacterium]|nr:ABC transporter ATP-binding protein [Pseudomonadota bacterium]